MSMRIEGLARRSFIMGMRLWPPLRIFAPSPCCWSMAIASGIVLGRRYSNDGGIICASPRMGVTPEHGVYRNSAKFEQRNIRRGLATEQYHRRLGAAFANRRWHSGWLLAPGC